MTPRCKSSSRRVVTMAVLSLLAGCTFGPGVTVTTTITTSPTTTTTTSTTIPPTTTSTSTTTTTTTTTTTLPPTTTSTTIPLITEGATIIVANASGVTGAAALLGQELGSLGFHVLRHHQRCRSRRTTRCQQGVLLAGGRRCRHVDRSGDGRHRRGAHARSRFDHRWAGKARRCNSRRDAGQGSGQEQTDRARH